MVEVPLSWKLSVSGAQDVKTQLQDIKNQFDRGEISTTQYAKGLREVNRDARTLTRTSDLQKNVFMASHPVINQLSRSMSAMNSVAHTALSISNALNLLWLRQGEDSTALAVAQHDLAQAQRDHNKAIAEGDLAAAAEAMERIRIASAQIKELGNPLKGINDGLVVFGVVISGIAAGFKIFKDIAPFLAPLTGFLGRLAAFTLPEAMMLVPGLFIAVGAAIAVAGHFIADFLVGLLGLDEWRENNGRILTEFFTKTMPEAVIGFANTFMQALFGVLGFLQNTFAMIWKQIWENDLVTAIKNGLTTAWQTLTGWVGELVKLITGMFRGGSSSSSGGTFNPVTGGVKPSGRASGFEGWVTSPTPMIVGEAGSEYVSITPHGKGSGGGATLVFNNYGTIASEREVFNKFDSWFKGQLKQRGWTNIL